jgi:hypothetical protein
VYCKNCYAPLADAPGGKCPKCGRKFNASDPRTYRLRPFPGKGEMVVHVLLTTICGIGAAFVVAMFQATRSSGH